MSSKNWRRLQLAVGALLLLSTHVAGDPAAASNERFALRLATSLGLAQPQNNVAVSPLLLQSALTLLYAGVSPQSSATAQQLRVALELQQLGDAEQALQQFEHLLGHLKESSAIGCQLRLLSEFYAEQRYTFSIRDEFEKRAATLGIGVQRLDFDDLASVAQTINYDFQTRSNYSVGELVSSGMLESSGGSDTPFLHVSALTFRAPWAQAFDPQETQCINFFNDGRYHKLVDAMFMQHRFKYADLPGLDAIAIEIPFATAGLSLLIVYPNQPNGLAALERQLQSCDLQQLRRRLSEHKIALTLPKFNLLAHTDLRSVLEQLGLSKLFTPDAQLHNVFNSFLASSAPHLTAVPHTVLLELNEQGAEAEQTFFATFTDLFRSTLSVVINHPFFFAIGNDKSLLLAGHVVDV
ncbi:serine protease inhibitor 42Dd [Drosophila grimshawi]|uniref:GH20377 n=1 Tax=Drosophila grimshawi TaxID=7222 RepID=B4J3Z9_DROGR|nr:serine protease inhibitor 42Dd [Drosophila grimshawi]EDW01582.1 GH20377 [Drosophila grimshawi]